MFAHRDIWKKVSESIYIYIVGGWTCSESRYPRCAVYGNAAPPRKEFVTFFLIAKVFDCYAQSHHWLRVYLGCSPKLVFIIKLNFVSDKKSSKTSSLGVNILNTPLTMNCCAQIFHTELYGIPFNSVPIELTELALS